MPKYLIALVQISCILIQNAISQYPPMYGMQPAAQIYGVNQIQSPSYYPPYQDAVYHNHRMYKHRRRSKKHYSSDSDRSNDYSSSCECDYSTCDQCSIVVRKKQCCTSFCNFCMAPANPNQGILLVPYPYPLVVSGSKSQTEAVTSEGTTGNEETATTQTPTKETPTTATTLPTTKPTTKKILRHKPTTKKPDIDVNLLKSLLETQNDNSPRPDELDDLVFKIPSKSNTKYVLTSLRQVNHNWLPKYGLVPIPDNIASNLMTQLRSMKVLQTHRDTPSSVTRPNAMDIVEKVYRQ